jgi:hypothetical protein
MVDQPDLVLAVVGDAPFRGRLGRRKAVDAA